MLISHMTSLTLFLFDPQVFLEERALTLYQLISTCSQEEIRRTEQLMKKSITLFLLIYKHFEKRRSLIPFTASAVISAGKVESSVFVDCGGHRRGDKPGVIDGKRSRRSTFALWCSRSLSCGALMYGCLC